MGTLEAVVLDGKATGTLELAAGEFKKHVSRALSCARQKNKSYGRDYRDAILFEGKGDKLQIMGTDGNILYRGILPVLDGAFEGRMIVWQEQLLPVVKGITGKQEDYRMLWNLEGQSLNLLGMTWALPSVAIRFPDASDIIKEAQEKPMGSGHTYNAGLFARIFKSLGDEECTLRQGETWKEPTVLTVKDGVYLVMPLEGEEK